MDPLAAEVDSAACGCPQRRAIRTGTPRIEASRTSTVGYGDRDPEPRTAAATCISSRGSRSCGHRARAPPRVQDVVDHRRAAAQLGLGDLPQYSVSTSRPAKVVRPLASAYSV